MDEKTERLRDIFVDVAGEEAVTESQAADRGSLLDDEAGVREALSGTVAEMRDRFEFETTLDTDALATLVRRFHEGADDAAIAADLGVEEERVREARLDLHLLREGEGDVDGVDRETLRGADPEALAAERGLDADALARAQRALAARERSRAAGHRFRSAFEDALAEAGLSETLTESIREDGLREATEDIDSLEEDADVSF